MLLCPITELNKERSKKAFSGDGKVFNGDYLMKAGLSFNIGNAFNSTVLLLEEE